MSYSLYDFRDLDLMLKIAEQGDGDGWVESRELADSLGVPEEEKIYGLGGRLAWMRSFGMLEKDMQTGRWRLSEGGERVTEARLRAAAAKTIDSIPDAQLVDVMAHVTTRYRLGDPVMAKMLQREFAYGTNPRSKIWTPR